MVASAVRKAGMRLTVISEDAEALLVTADDVIGPIEPIGKVRLPGRSSRRTASTAARSPSGWQGPHCARPADVASDRPRPEVHPVELDPDLRSRIAPRRGRAAGA